MTRPDFRRFLQCAAVAMTIGVASAATPSTVAAQATTTGEQTTTRTTTDDDDGMDLGWLGLLGLAGLLGLRRKDDHVHHTDTTTRR